jgi:cytochrome c biogenesis protein CcdA
MVYPTGKSVVSDVGMSAAHASALIPCSSSLYGSGLAFVAAETSVAEIPLCETIWPLMILSEAARRFKDPLPARGNL